jgi:hypothetical protein
MHITEYWEIWDKNGIFRILSLFQRHYWSVLSRFPHISREIVPNVSKSYAWDAWDKIIWTEMSTLLGEYTIGFGFPHYSFVIFELEMGSFESPYPLLCGQVIVFLSKSIFFEIINQTYIPQVSPRKTGQIKAFTEIKILTTLLMLWTYKLVQMKAKTYG